MKAKDILKDDIIFYNVLSLHNKIPYKYTRINEEDLALAKQGYLVQNHKKFEIMALLLELEVIKLPARVSDLF